MRAASRSSSRPTAFSRVTDNGRGIPVDPHPKFKKKSALEVIMTTLHAGGKFNSKVYDTSGGLHGVGVSVANALSETLEVEVARGQKLYRQTYTRGTPDGPIKSLGRDQEPARHDGPLPARPKIFGKGAAFKPARLFRMARSKAYLFRGVEIRWSCAKAAARRRQRHAGEARCSISRAGSRTFWPTASTGQQTVTNEMFAGRMREDAKATGSVEWAIAWIASDDGFLSSYCNTVPTPDGGTHEAGLRAALTKGLRALWRADRQQARGADHGRRRARHRRRHAVRVHPRAGVPGPDQGPARQRQEAARIVESAVRDAFDHWLTGNPNQANRLLDWVVDRSEERLRRRKEKEIGRQTATRKLRLPGKLADCARERARKAPRSSSSRAIPPAARPSRRATGRRQAVLPLARQDPQRGERKLVQARRQSAA